MPESKSTGRFIKVRCDKCKNEQMIFEKISTNVECLICGKDTLLAEPTGGKSKINEINARVLEVLG